VSSHSFSCVTTISRYNCGDMNCYQDLARLRYRESLSLIDVAIIFLAESLLSPAEFSFHPVTAYLSQFV